MQRIPIKTKFGELYGRDRIYLDEFNVENTTNIIRLVGSFNVRDELVWPKYIMTFNGVMAFRCIELDSGDFQWKSSLEEVIDSEWILSLGGKINNSYHHYFIQSYDEVIDIISESLTLNYT